MAVGIPAGQSLASKASEAFMDWMRKAAYNIAARSEGFPSMGENLKELIQLATTPVTEDEQVYTGGATPTGVAYTSETRWSEDPDLLSVFLGQKTPEQADLRHQPLRPTAVSQYFKDLPTYSIKEHTEVRSVSEDADWPTDVLNKLQKLKQGDVIKLDPTQVGIDPKPNLSAYTLSAGRDDQGVYVSLFDVWDFGKGYAEKWVGGQSILRQMQAPLMQAVGQPFAIYDRYYIPDTDIQLELEDREQLAMHKQKWQKERERLLSPMPLGTYTSIGEALKAK